MNLRIATLLLLALCLPVTTAVAQTDVYDNGPTNGTTNAWTMSSGFIVSDSFTLGGPQPLDGLVFAAWLYPGDVLQSAEVSITSSEFGGTVFFDGTVNFFQSNCATNQLGFSVCEEVGVWDYLSLDVGTYWLNIQNGVTTTGDPIYWDENSGPNSQASQKSLGTIPSESFTLLGCGCGTGTTSTTNTTSTTPEPTTLMLFGSGILALAGAIRGKAS